MKTLYFLSFILLLTGFSYSSAYSQENSVAITPKLWPDRSTHTLKPGRKVWPLLGVKKMGVRNNMEWQIQPLFFFVAPNLGLKKRWSNEKGLSIASLHKISYPSIYLNLISREGTGGFLPEDSEVPPILHLKNEFLLTLDKWSNLFTFRLGLGTAFKLKATEQQLADLDLPFIYNRTLAFGNTPNLYFGLNVIRDLTSRLTVEGDFGAFKVDFASNRFVYESQLVLFWKFSDRFGVKLGAAAAYGQYPYGAEFQMIPLVDVVFGFGRKKHKSPSW